jgi:hypothetical protein
MGGSLANFADLQSSDLHLTKRCLIQFQKNLAATYFMPNMPNGDLQHLREMTLRSA